VYLPAAEEAAPTAKRLPPPTARQGGGETILVVEDEQAMREVAVRILRRNGYRVLEAADGHEALSTLDGRVCDLLLTDVIMPQMSGRELVERVRERLPDLPVLYMSGYSRGVLGPQRALDSSVALIQKPFSEQALVEKVRAVLPAEAPKAG
jgi:CheY-like chemotaxis protein